jgi:hypothetical protein
VLHGKTVPAVLKELTVFAIVYNTRVYAADYNHVITQGQLVCEHQHAMPEL